MDLDAKDLIDLSFYAPQKMSIDMLSYEISERLGAFVYGIEKYPLTSSTASANSTFSNDSQNLVEHILIVLKESSATKDMPQNIENENFTKQALTHQLSAYNKPILFLRESSHYFSWVLQGLSFLEKYYALGDISTQLDFLLQEAIAHRASDIHLEHKGDFGSIRFRIDGCLREIARLDSHSASKLSSKIKLESKLDITESRLPQDGRYGREFDEVEYDFRISCVPLLSGESLVLRILYKHKERISLEGLGLSKEILEILSRALSRKNGLILITGPTGSGKSTTLYAALEALKTLQKKLITLEDPIEYQIPLATQIQINPEIGFSFYEALSFVLRQDPDIIMIGEIRDRQTLELALNASLTGHLVLASLHSNDCISTLERLFEMGAPRSVIESSLICIIAQRLLGRLCPHCKTHKNGTLSKEQHGDELAFYALGCEKCQGLGINGREVVAQGIYFDKWLKQAFYEMPSDIAKSQVKNTLPSTESVHPYVDSSDWRGNLKKVLLAKNLPTLKDDALRKKELLDYREIDQLD